MNSNQEGLRAERSSGLHGYELEPTYNLISDPVSLVGMDEMIKEFGEKVTELKEPEGLWAGAERGEEWEDSEKLIELNLNGWERKVL